MDITEYLEENVETRIFQSPIPESCKNSPCCLGIDEAGRGPVLGPMVYGICYCPISFMEELKELGFADSKTLKKEDRDKLLSVIEQNIENIGWAIKIISPTSLSNDMLRSTKISLNEISHNAAIELTKVTIKDGADIKEMYVDTVGPAQKYQDKLSEIFKSINVTVTPKADSKFPIVSAASICAKVARDRCLEGWKFGEGEFPSEYGCGYTSDSLTQKWLKDIIDPVFGHPQFVRFCWSTCSEMLKKHARDVTWEDDDDEGKPKKKKSSFAITSFYTQEKNNQKVDHCRFFKERNLQQVSSL